MSSRREQRSLSSVLFVAGPSCMPVQAASALSMYPFLPCPAGFLHSSLLPEMADHSPPARPLRRRAIQVVSYWTARLKKEDRPAVYQALVAALAEDDAALQLAAVGTLRALVDDWCVGWQAAGACSPRQLPCFGRTVPQHAPCSACPVHGAPELPLVASLLAHRPGRPSPTLLSFCTGSLRRHSSWSMWRHASSSWRGCCRGPASLTASWRPSRCWT